MKIKIVSSSVSQEKFQFAASYVVNGRVAFDAGSLGFATLSEQKRIRHVFLSHAHLDHIASLPVFLDNTCAPGDDCPTIYGNTHVLDCLRQFFFNDQVWPDLVRLSPAESPLVRFVTLESGQPVRIDDLCVTPVPLDHGIPCFGFLIEQGESAVALVSDTGPTQEIWERARSLKHLQAVLLECAYPEERTWLAQRALHLTPAQFSAEYEKLGRDVKMIAIHIKAGCYAEVVTQLEQLGIPQLVIGEPGREYDV